MGYNERYLQGVCTFFGVPHLSPSLVSPLVTRDTRRISSLSLRRRRENSSLSPCTESLALHRISRLRRAPKAQVHRRSLENSSLSPKAFSSLSHLIAEGALSRRSREKTTLYLFSLLKKFSLKNPKKNLLLCCCLALCLLAPKVQASTRRDNTVSPSAREMRRETRRSPSPKAVSRREIR